MCSGSRTTCCAAGPACRTSSSAGRTRSISMRWGRSASRTPRPRGISAAGLMRPPLRRCRRPLTRHACGSGCDARANLMDAADALPARAWMRLVRRPPYEVQTEPRQRPANIKAAIIVEREFKTLRLETEAVAEFAYQPVACAQPYRMVVVRKNISVEQGDQRLFDEIRYFFYLTNDHETPAADVVFLANDRCNQENLIDQLKHGVGATRMPVDTLLSNWAYMVMAALAWTLKAWFALRLPQTGRWAARYAAEKNAVLRMEFKAFLHAFMLIPVQVVRTKIGRAHV